MSIFTKLVAEIFRDYDTAGVPSSGAHKPVKSEIRQWGTEAETALADAQQIAADAATAAVGSDIYRFEIARRAALFHSAV